MGSDDSGSNTLKSGVWNVTKKRDNNKYYFKRHCDLDGSPASEIVTNRTTYVCDKGSGIYNGN